MAVDQLYISRFKQKLSDIEIIPITCNLQLDWLITNVNDWMTDKMTDY